MSSKDPASSFSEQDNTSERAERTEPEPIYLSADSDSEEENAVFTSGAPGFATVSSFLDFTCGAQNPAFESRNNEILNMQKLVSPEEDRKLSPSTSASKQDSDSDFECENDLEKTCTEKPKKKNVKLTSKALRVKRNFEHGLNTEVKKAKKGDLWEYAEQTLSPDVVLQVLPMPTEAFVFRSVMTMKEVEKEVPSNNIDNTLLTALNKFGAPTCTTTKLRDVQTEYAGF